MYLFINSGFHDNRIHHLRSEGQRALWRSELVVRCVRGVCSPVSDRRHPLHHTVEAERGPCLAAYYDLVQDITDILQHSV